jgi:hypothetical protein
MNPNRVVTLVLGNGHCIWIGNDAKCVSHWRRVTYVSVLGNMGYTCLFVDDVEMCNCNLTRGRHVIGGGTGELPPKEMNISVLGCIAC